MACKQPRSAPLLKAQPSPCWDVEMGLRLMASPSLRIPALVTIICISVGMLHPIATEASKSAHLVVCTVRKGSPECGWQGEKYPSDDAKFVMPFHAATLTIAAEVAAVAASFGIITADTGSVVAAARTVLRPSELLRFLPVGIIYGFGDFLQTVACNAASAPVILVVGQSKLLIAALLSKLILRKEEKTNWFRLVIITCAAIAGTDIGAGQLVGERRSELYGALLALLKAGLSSAGAVLTEKFFKRGAVSFWVTSFQVQFMMLVASLMLLPWTAGTWQTTSPVDFFAGGPYPLCTDCAKTVSEGESCSCVDRRGWDVFTCLAVLGIVVNGLTTGLTLRHLSAVTKSVCNAASAGVFYIIYVWLGFKPFNIAQANIMAIVAISSYEYAMEKISKPSKPQAKCLDGEGPLRDAGASSHQGFSSAMYQTPSAKLFARALEGERSSA